MISCCLIHVVWKRRQGEKNHEHNNELILKDVKGLKENVTDLGTNIDNEGFRVMMIGRIKEKLRKLEKFVTTDPDDVSGDTPQVDLKQVDKCLEGILSKCERQQKGKYSTVLHCW